MPRFRVFHLTLSDAQVEEINSGGGWSCPVGALYAGLTLPRRDAENAPVARIVDALERGVETGVAEIDADSLGEVFALTNHIDHPWQENAGVRAARATARSTSVGDLVLNRDAGSVHFCLSVGWHEIAGAGIRDRLAQLDVPPGTADPAALH